MRDIDYKLADVLRCGQVSGLLSLVTLRKFKLFQLGLKLLGFSPICK